MINSLLLIASLCSAATVETVFQNSPSAPPRMFYKIFNVGKWGIGPNPSDPIPGPVYVEQSANGVVHVWGYCPDGYLCFITQEAEVSGRTIELAPSIVPARKQVTVLSQTKTSTNKVIIVDNKVYKYSTPAPPSLPIPAKQKESDGKGSTRLLQGLKTKPIKKRIEYDFSKSTNSFPVFQTNLFIKSFPTL